MDGAEHVVNGVGLDDVLHLEILVLVHDDVGFVGGAEQVVPHPENVLVGAGQEKRHVVRLASLGLVQRNFVAHIFQIYELFHLSIAVAGDVAKRRR